MYRIVFGYLTHTLSHLVYMVGVNQVVGCQFNYKIIYDLIGLDLSTRF